MGTLKFNENNLEDYVARIGRVKETRVRLVEELCDKIKNNLTCLEFVEEKITSYKRYFEQDSGKKQKRTKDIRLYWESGKKGDDPFNKSLLKPTWRLISKAPNDSLSRLKWPTRHHIRRIYLQSEYPNAVKNSDELKSNIKDFEEYSIVFKKIRKALVDVLPNTAQKKKGGRYPVSTTIPVWVEDKRMTMFFVRREEIAKLKSQLMFAIEQVGEIESQLEDLMLEFNSIDKRRHMSLAVRWDLNIKNGITLGSLKGPTWCQLLINLAQGKRNIRKVKSINREMIRDTGYRRFEEQVLLLYKNINILKTQRMQVLTPLFKVARTLRYR